MPMTAEEKAELTQEISKAVTANMATAFADAMKPVNESVQALQANQQALADQLTANAKAEDSEKRKAVADVHGDIVANALTGSACEGPAIAEAQGEAIAFSADSSSSDK